MRVSEKTSNKGGIRATAGGSKIRHRETILCKPDKVERKRRRYGNAHKEIRGTDRRTHKKNANGLRHGWEEEEKPERGVRCREQPEPAAPPEEGVTAVQNKRVRRKVDRGPARVYREAR